MDLHCTICWHKVDQGACCPCVCHLARHRPPSLCDHLRAALAQLEKNNLSRPAGSTQRLIADAYQALARTTRDAADVASAMEWERRLEA